MTSSSISQIQYKKKAPKETLHTNTFALLSEKETEETNSVNTGGEDFPRLPLKAPIDRMERRKWEAAKKKASFTWQRAEQMKTGDDQKNQREV